MVVLSQTFQLPRGLVCMNRMKCLGFCCSGEVLNGVLTTVECHLRTFQGASVRLALGTQSLTKRGE